MFGEQIYLVLLCASSSAMLAGSNLPTISQLVGLINQMNQTIFQQNHEISELVVQNRQMNRTIIQQNQQINQMAVQHNQETNLMNVKIDQLNKTLGSHMQSSNVIAFSASKRSEIPLMGDHQTIDFEIVLTNLGNCYDKRHGHFVASVRGLYQFSVTMYGWQGQFNSYEMVKNGNMVCRAYSASTNTGRSQGSCTVMMVLEINDMVWVRFAYGGRHLYGADYSIFSGVLIDKIE